MALCVRSAAMSVRTWCRIGRSRPRRGHPDHPHSTLRLRFPAKTQQNIDFSKVEIKTIDLGHNTYRLEGQGGNITVAVGSDGIIMVDGQFAPLHDKIKAAIAGISPLPIKYLINTHFHGDHTGGNEAFQNDGAIVVAQDNIRVRLAAGTTNGITGARQDTAGRAGRIAEANLYRWFDNAGGWRS